MRLVGGRAGWQVTWVQAAAAAELLLPPHPSNLSHPLAFQTGLRCRPSRRARRGTLANLLPWSRRWVLVGQPCGARCRRWPPLQLAPDSTHLAPPFPHPPSAQAQQPPADVASMGDQDSCSAELTESEEGAEQQGEEQMSASAAAGGLPAGKVPQAAPAANEQAPAAGDDAPAEEARAEATTAAAVAAALAAAQPEVAAAGAGPEAPIEVEPQVVDPQRAVEQAAAQKQVGAGAWVVALWGPLLLLSAPSPAL